MQLLSNGKLVDIPKDHPLYLLMKEAEEKKKKEEGG